MKFLLPTDITMPYERSYAYIRVDLINDIFHVWYIDHGFCDELWLLSDPVRSIDIFNFFRINPNPIEMLMGIKPWPFTGDFWIFVLHELFNLATVAKRQEYTPKDILLLCAPIVPLVISEGIHKCEGCLAVYTKATYCDECVRLWNDYHARGFIIIKIVSYAAYNDLRSIFRIATFNRSRVDTSFEVEMNADFLYSPYEECDTEVNTYIHYDCVVTCYNKSASTYWRMHPNTVFEISRTFNGDFDFKYNYEYNVFSIHGIKSP